MFCRQKLPILERANEWEGYLSFPPGNKLPGSPGASKTLCQAPALKHCSTKSSSAWGSGWMGSCGGVLCRGPPSSSHLPAENQICAQCSDTFLQWKVKEHCYFIKIIQAFALVNADEMLFCELIFVFLTYLVSQIYCAFRGNRKI